MKWRGIDVAVLADAPWPARQRMLAILAADCAAAAVRNRDVLLDRALARAMAVEPDAPDVVAARVAANGWDVEEQRRTRDRLRRRAYRAAARAQAAA